MPLRLCIPALLASVLLTGFSGASARTLTPSATVEFPEHPVFYYPIDLACLPPDGQRFVLNRGDGTIVVLSAGWDVIRQFGRLGEGPGEITGPIGLVAWADTLWVATPKGLIGYSLTGESVGTRDIPWGITSLTNFRDQLLATWTGGSRGQGAGVVLEYDGDVVQAFGPSCDASNTAQTSGFARCLGWQALPGPAGGCVLLNHFGGDALLFDAVGAKPRKKDLGLGTGKVLGQWSFQSVINDACADPAGGYWVLCYKLDGVARLCRFSDTWELKGSATIDPEIGQGAIRVLPDKTLCLVEEQASRLQIFERPNF
jgi:hypothetical protein